MIHYSFQSSFFDIFVSELRPPERSRAFGWVLLLHPTSSPVVGSQPTPGSPQSSQSSEVGPTFREPRVGEGDRDRGAVCIVSAEEALSPVLT